MLTSRLEYFLYKKNYLVRMRLLTYFTEHVRDMFQGNTERLANSLSRDRQSIEIEINNFRSLHSPRLLSSIK